MGADLFSLALKERTKTNGWKLYRGRSKLKMRNFLTMKASKQWNSLPFGSHGGSITGALEQRLEGPWMVWAVTANLFRPKCPKCPQMHTRIQPPKMQCMRGPCACAPPEHMPPCTHPMQACTAPHRLPAHVHTSPARALSPAHVRQGWTGATTRVPTERALCHMFVIMGPRIPACMGVRLEDLLSSPDSIILACLCSCILLVGFMAYFAAKTCSNLLFAEVFL